MRLTSCPRSGLPQVSPATASLAEVHVLTLGLCSYGFELLPVPAHCARLQLQEVKRRWAMWGLNGNQSAEVHEGDFRGNGTVAKCLREADAVVSVLDTTRSDFSSLRTVRKFEGDDQGTMT